MFCTPCLELGNTYFHGNATRETDCFCFAHKAFTCQMAPKFTGEISLTDDTTQCRYGCTTSLGTSDNFYSVEEFGGIADTVLGVSKMFIRLTLDSVNNLIQNIQVGNFY